MNKTWLFRLKWGNFRSGTGMSRLSAIGCLTNIHNDSRDIPVPIATDYLTLKSHI